MSGVVRFGVLGCADIALRRILPAMTSHPGVRLVAVASRDRDKAATVATRFACEPVTGYRSLLDRDDIDAVYVPLPPALHAEWIRAALTSGKHVLAEKPLTPSGPETTALTTLAGVTGRVLVENVMFLHHRRHRLVRELIANGAIGDPVAFTGSFTIPPRPSGDIRYSASLGGGALLDNAVYPMIAAQLVLGRGLRVVGAVLRNDGASGVDVAGAALLRRDDGVTAQVTFGMDHGYTSEYHVLGRLGRITVERAFHPAADADTEIVVHRQGHQVPERIAVPPDDQYGNTLTAFVRAVRGGITGAFGEITVSTAELVDQVWRCASAGT
ncbi:Gfo/Idh/MocA family protein [Kibdelosporangium persicum]|uniref:Glucose-fructose oxidoreductase n=1 Tax=Kibdelosporangium persicum TaxID=2698649 RepID=A0ABX2FJG5_9PSEU|nr:Gfo/Idh/MocA family oxidoreductase [Kibdelosporangium persicum]NRN71403.1 Glucose-fructose oxidoreductase [Kibdelosporangium persicum]